MSDSVQGPGDTGIKDAIKEFMFCGKARDAISAPEGSVSFMQGNFKAMWAQIGQRSKETISRLQNFWELHVYLRTSQAVT